MTVEAVAVGLSVSPVAGTRRFLDRQSGCTFWLNTPGQRPDLWEQYLDGALRTYRHYDVESVLEYDQIRDGRSSSLFFTALNTAGEVVAGVRMRGPFAIPDDIDVLLEWRGRTGESELRELVAARLKFGVVEVRGGWVDRAAADRRALGDAMSRCLAYAPLLHGVRFGFGTAATFTAARYRPTGGVIAPVIPGIPYPDTRYSTVPVWWDSRRYRALVEDTVHSVMTTELRELGITTNRGGRSRRKSGCEREVLRSHVR
ncbi:hypothetical protein ACWDSJ_32730 [Nocardia sp. NPDC003482]|uniref:hypothetical protein n=1 Tax=Nocardia sp. NPDC004068 TaxID=3364303 RepID=UPI00367AA39B